MMCFTIKNTDSWLVIDILDTFFVNQSDKVNLVNIAHFLCFIFIIIYNHAQEQMENAKLCSTKGKIKPQGLHSD